MGTVSGAVRAEAADLRASLARRTTRDLIADKLIALIASGVLTPGDEMPSERELAEWLAVSRETIRGAVQALAARGLIEISQGARSRVAAVDLSALPVMIAAPTAIDRYDIASVHAARLLIELHVVGEAATRIGARDLQRLRSSLEAQAAAEGDFVRFLICDREFHVTVYRACGNPLLADFVTDLYTYMMQHRRMAMAEPGAVARSYADHVAIVAALEAHDAAAVVAAFRAHLERIYETTRAMIARAGRA